MASKENQLTWYSNKDSRNKIAEEIKLSDIRIKQLLKSLTTKGILIQQTKGIYKLSAKYFSTTK